MPDALELLEGLAKSYDRDALTYYKLDPIKDGSRIKDATPAQLQFAAIGSIYRLAAHDIRKILKKLKQHS